MYSIFWIEKVWYMNRENFMNRQKFVLFLCIDRLKQIRCELLSSSFLP